MGTLSFTSEKSAGELLFAQPVTRTEVLIGKFVGLFASIFSATVIGFGLAGLIIGLKAGNRRIVPLSRARGLFALAGADFLELIGSDLCRLPPQIKSLWRGTLRLVFLCAVL